MDERKTRKVKRQTEPKIDKKKSTKIQTRGKVTIRTNEQKREDRIEKRENRIGAKRKAEEKHEEGQKKTKKIKETKRIKKET